MSETMTYERVETSFQGYDRQVFPRRIDDLTTLLDTRLEVTGVLLGSVGRKMDDFVDKEFQPTTEDRYAWFWGMYFENKEGKVAALFPTCAVKLPEYAPLDRSATFFVEDSVSSEYVERLTEELIQQISDECDLFASWAEERIRETH